MMKKIHTNKGAKAPSHEGNGKQSWFRYPKGSSASPSFIQKHGREADQINENQITEKYKNDVHNNPYSVAFVLRNVSRMSDSAAATKGFVTLRHKSRIEK